MTAIMMDFELDKRDKAILDWVKEKRQDLLGFFKEIFDVFDSRDEKLPDPVVIARICFEAGRRFQHDNPDLGVNDSYMIYLND